MYNDHSPIYLIKFMNKRYVTSFLEDGLLFMNNVKFFCEYEEKQVRGDIHEGLAATLRADKTSVSFGTVNMKSLVGKIDIRHDIDDKINIYSMTMIRYIDVKEAVNNELKLSEDFSTFGDTCILIVGDNIPIFFKRLEQALEKADIKKWSGNIVEYINRENHHGEMNIFQKFYEYKWQYEWRLGLRQDFSDVFQLKIGNLRDIAQVYNTEEMLKEQIRIGMTC